MLHWKWIKEQKQMCFEYDTNLPFGVDNSLDPKISSNTHVLQTWVLGIMK